MKQTVTYLLIVGTVVAAYLFGAFAPVERGLASLRFRLLPIPATGDTVVVGIDSRSLQALNVWPWPREYHARLIDRLLAAGAKGIALDIDFSSHSNERSDAALEAALQRAGDKIILATFKQPARDANGNLEYEYTLPIPRFARSARLGHVNVRVESDSLVWQHESFDITGDAHLPGMATLLADRSLDALRSFTIDYGIRPDTLTYASFVDVLNGGIDPAAFAGKMVIVGAVALELGDRIPVPVHQILPGPVVQALIAETIGQDRRLNPVRPWLVAALAFLVGVGSARFLVFRSWQTGGLVVVGLAAVLFCISLAIQKYTPVLLEISPVLAGPLVLYILGLTRSIDRLASAFRRERFEAYYRRAMMGAVVDFGFDGIAIADRDGMFELVNPSAARIIGEPEGELEGKPVHSFLPTAPEIENLYDGGIGGGHTANFAGPLELVLPRGDKDVTIELVVNAARLSLQNGKRGENEQRIVYIYTFRDITDRKEVELAQRRAVEEAEAASRAKTEFLHNMSHELRTPLNAIIGFSDIIRNELMGPVGVPKYLDYIGDINDSGQHLLGVVNDILDMSKIESGEMSIVEDELYLPHVVTASRRMVEERARAAGLDLVVDVAADLPMLLGDDRMIRQMLLNLLSNAVKFTDEGGVVTVSAGVEPDGAILLSVTDTGIGIDEKDFEAILEPFGQADASLSRTYEGTGLGLPLVKSMIELHDGKLTIESEVGKGSTFGLLFPASRRCAGRAPEASVGERAIA